MKLYAHVFLKKAPALFMGVVWKDNRPCGVVSFGEDGYVELMTDVQGEKEGMLKEELLDAFVEGFITTEGNGRVEIKCDEVSYTVDYFGELELGREGYFPLGVNVIDTQDGRILYIVNYPQGLIEVVSCGDFDDKEVEELLKQSYQLCIENIVRG